MTSRVQVGHVYWLKNPKDGEAMTVTAIKRLEELPEDKDMGGKFLVRDRNYAKIVLYGIDIGEEFNQERVKTGATTQITY